jgi:hypothetical protein
MRTFIAGIPPVRREPALAAQAKSAILDEIPFTVLGGD